MSKSDKNYEKVTKVTRWQPWSPGLTESFVPTTRNKSVARDIVSRLCGHSVTIAIARCLFFGIRQGEWFIV